MKNILILVSVLVFILGCSEPEANLQLSNPEAFAFDLGDSWEVNASVKSKGFKQLEQDDKFEAKINYLVDIITPQSDTIVNIYSDKINLKETEEILDIILEAQIEIDSSFGQGDYKLIFNVTDELSTQADTISVAFNLMK